MDNVTRRNQGLPYITNEAVLEEQKRARRLTQAINTADRGDFEGIQKLVRELLGKGEEVFINPPFYCDYGFNIEVGRNTFINYNCTILDTAKVIIGERCQIAPSVSIYTAGHPVHPAIRDTGYEYGAEVVLGDSVWIGGNTVICPGVHIGECSVIGAGSVVTRDIPPWVIAAGNPCRVVRPVTEEDRRHWFRGRAFDAEAWEDIQRILSERGAE